MADGASRKILLSVARIAAATVLLLVAAYVSLVWTSEPLDAAQQAAVTRGIAVLEQRGFGTEAFALRRLASFRTTDHWWNRRTRQVSAYAATNFPFEIVTLYEPFFAQPVDDVERASILLHEARHLLGGDEPDAYTEVWLRKKRLGWTRATHGETDVFRSVTASTSEICPDLFRCGDDGRSDCVP